ncbi:MAG: FtsH protease activity modulator HflK [Candidatus Hydrogenedentota bacterium]
MTYRKRSGPEVVNAGGSGQFKKPDFSNLNLNPKAIVIAVLVLVVLIWFMRGGPVYTVEPDEEGIVLTFGKYTKSTPPGLHFKMPWPIQTVETPNVQEIKHLEFGFRTVEDARNYRTFEDDPQMLEEAQMLTGDENVVNCAMVVQYRIRDPLPYLFNFHEGEAEETLRDIGHAALRQTVGDHPVDDVLTERRPAVAGEIQEQIQEIADSYGLGVSITALRLQDVRAPEEVAAAFRDVASAREDRERIINEARAYQSEQLPRAEGEAERLRQEAQGYKEARIAEAEGEVSRLLAIAQRYEATPEVTRARLYLETMSEVLPELRLTVVDPDAGVLNLRNLSGGQGLFAGGEPGEDE